MDETRNPNQNVGVVRRWFTLREKIRAAGSGPDRHRLLRLFGDEIRSIMPLVSRVPTVQRDDINRALEVATAHGAVLGAWLLMDPFNPDWPGRDRLFAFRREDLINSCALLSALGFFPKEDVARLVERVENEGRRAAVPGLEAPGAPSEEIPNLLWESALESARSKRRWREGLSGDVEWVDRAWLDSPAAWRSCGMFDVADPATDECRELPLRPGEEPAGLVALVKVGRNTAARVAESWSLCGWTAEVVNRNDCLNLYEILAVADMAKPLAIMLALSSAPGQPHISRTVIRRREEGLLGEMPDNQFNQLMGERLGL